MPVAGGTESTSDETLGDNDYPEKNPLLLTGVCLCVLAVLLSTAFVCYRQWKSRQLASKLTSTPVHEALLSDTENISKTRRQTRQQSATVTINDSNDHSQK